jgi:hypothetical protein
MSRIIEVSNGTDNKPAKGGKNMKKILFMLIVLVTLIMTSVLYGTHSLIIDEMEALTLEQAYMANYPETLPDMMSNQMTTTPF